MLELWESIYTKQHFVRVDELSMHSESFDLTEFTVSQSLFPNKLYFRWF